MLGRTDNGAHVTRIRFGVAHQAGDRAEVLEATCPRGPSANVLRAINVSLLDRVLADARVKRIAID